MKTNEPVGSQQRPTWEKLGKRVWQHRFCAGAAGNRCLYRDVTCYYHE